MMLREYVTLPSLCLPYLFSFMPPEDYFVLLDAEVHQLFKQNLFGGLSVIVRRYAEVGVTKIKEHTYGKNAVECRQIQCLDANLLYTACLGKDMMTGAYVVRKAEANFKPSIANKGTFTVQFLQFLSLKNSEPIQHALSPEGEYTAYFKGRLFYADGFVPISDRRPRALWIEVNTCATHGCPKCYPDREEISGLTGKTHGEIYSESCERIDLIRAKFQSKGLLGMPSEEVVPVEQRV